MPTPPPEPVAEPASPEEAQARKAAIKLVADLIEGFNTYAYGTRSYMPHHQDYTDSAEAWQNLKEFAEARPDWTHTIVVQALMRMAGK